MKVLVNGKPVPHPGDIGSLVPRITGTSPWRLALDAGNGLRLEANARDDGRFDIAYVEAGERFRAAPRERDALISTLRSFAARDFVWRHAGPWTLDQADREKRQPVRRRRPPGRSAERDERHATVAGLVVMGGAALLVILQLLGVKLRLPEISLPEPVNSTGAKALLVAFLLFWFVFALAAAYKLWEVRRARGWKRASGTITSSGIGTDVSEPRDGVRDVRHVARIAYRFNIASRTYHGSRIDLAERPAAMTVEEVSQRYPVGKTVDVYYDPADPHDCVLDRNLPAGAAKGCLVVMLVVVPALAVGMVILTAGPGWVRAVLPNSQPHVVVISALASLLTALYAWSEHVRRGLASQWPAVDGVIVESGIEQRSNAGDSSARSFVPRVVYRYTVSGRTYENNQIRLGVEIGGSRTYAEELVTSYANGTRVTVHYDPANPQDSALEWEGTIPKVAAAVAAVLLAIAVWAAI